ncbi:MAG: hypothetical protein M1823_001915 [Watsoniomyces obsoletus]|nr:MAG: hypothetical protein M1823_001915 [Watsoniomyces obsoletus]
MELDILNPSQLANLTNNIAQQLEKTKKPKTSGKHRDKDAEKVQKPAKSTQSSKFSAGVSTQLQNGTKKDKKTKTWKPRDEKSDTKSAHKPKSNGTRGEGAPYNELLQEVIALGGTEEDLELMGGADSDADIGLDSASKKGKAAVDKDLQKDIAGFVRQLKFNGDSAKEVDTQNIKPSKKQKRTAQEAEKSAAEHSGKAGDTQNTKSSKKEKRKSQAAEKNEIEHSGKEGDAQNVKPGRKQKGKAQDVEKPVNQNNQESHPKMAKPPVSLGKSQPPSKEARDKNSSQPQLLFSPCPSWHAATLPPLAPARNNPSLPSQAVLNRFHQHAKELLQAENDLYTSTHLSGSSSHRFLSTIMSSGTLSDKVSALTLLIQESPVHTMKALERLLGLAKKRSRGQAVSALGALKDLLAQGELLPPQRRLKSFVTQPQLVEVLQDRHAREWQPGQPLPGSLTEAHLVVWAFEDWLKSTYYQIIQLLEVWCSDEVEFARARALGYVYELLMHKPEQEANLLRLLVNKLGDTDKKIASKASFLLLQLQAAHPPMKTIIISTIENELVFRPRQSSHAIYYAVITLNQTVLSSREPDVASKLLQIYFGLFTALLKESPKNAANAEAKDSQAVKSPKHTDNKGTDQGERKKDKKAPVNQPEEDSREKIISAVLTGVNRAFPYAGNDETIVRTHLDTLFKITHSSNFNSSVQALMLLQQLSSAQRLESDRFYRTLYESLLDPRLLTSSKQAMYLNLLFRSLKADLDVKRVKAFVKRLLQVLTLHQPPFVCGALYLIKEIEEIFPALHGLIDQPENEYDGDEEHFEDVMEEGEGDERHAADQRGSKGGNPTASAQPNRYDGRKRDPQHSNADRSCLWELLPFLNHFHPSVKLFASRLLLNEPKPPKPDLSLHTLIHFLDRFVYRNVKSNPALRGASVMQPLHGDNEHGVLLLNRDSGKAQAPLNTAEFLAKRVEDISVDEVFFHKYFAQVDGRRGHSNRSTKKKPKSRDDDDDEAEDDDDDDDDDEIWKAIVGSKPEMAGSDDDGPDLDDSDSAVEDMSDDDDDDDDDDDGVPLGGDDDDDVSGISGDDASLVEYHEDSEGDEAVVTADGEGLFAPEQARSMAGTSKRGQPSSETKDSRRAKRRKLKDLPVFASVEDYAEMLAGEEEEG